MGTKFLIIGRLSITERGDPQMKYRIAHERRGIKGQRRPFMEPALDDNHRNFVKELRESLKKIRKA